MSMEYVWSIYVYWVFWGCFFKPSLKILCHYNIQPLAACYFSLALSGCAGKVDFKNDECFTSLHRTTRSLSARKWKRWTLQAGCAKLWVSTNPAHPPGQRTRWMIDFPLNHTHTHSRSVTLNLFLSISFFLFAIISPATFLHTSHKQSGLSVRHHPWYT